VRTNSRNDDHWGATMELICEKRRSGVSHKSVLQFRRRTLTCSPPCTTGNRGDRVKEARQLGVREKSYQESLGDAESCIGLRNARRSKKRTFKDASNKHSDRCSSPNHFIYCELLFLTQ
jgi:hypothetical protein